MKIRIITNIFFVFLSIILCIFYLPKKIEVFDNISNYIMCLVGFINILIFWRTYIKTKGASWISYEVLFLVSFMIVHFQIPFLASIGIEPEKPDFIWINKNVVNYATWLSLLAMLMWILGYLIRMLHNLRDSTKHKKINYINKYKIDSSKLDILLVITFIAFIALVGQDFLKGSYNGGDNWGAGSNYVFVILKVLLYLKIIYFFNENKYKIKRLSEIIPKLLKNIVFFSILVAYIMIFLLAGDRDPVLSIVIVFACSYSIFIRKVSFKFFIVALFGGAVFFSIIQLGRSRDITDKNIFSRSIEEYNNKDNEFNPTNELASSNRILYRALDVVPNQHPYLYGLTFGSEIVGVVPFGGSTYQELTNLPVIYKSSSYFFTVLGQGIYFAYGEGTEILADIYINFGFYGVIILMFLLGYFVSYAGYRCNIQKKNIYILIYIVLTMGALYINRSHFLEPLKTIFYILLIDRLLIKKKLIK